MSDNVFSLNRSPAYLRRRANENRRQGRYGEAATLLRLAMAGENPPSQETLWDYSELLSGAGLYDASDEMLYEALQTCPEEEQSACFYALGENAYARGDMQRVEEYLSVFLDGPCADEAYNHALELLEGAQAATGDVPLRRGDPAAYAHRLVTRALGQMRAGYPANAARLLRRAVHAHAEAESYSVLAVCMLAQEQYDEAARCCRRALALQPSDVRARCTLAYVYAAQENRKKAQQTFARALHDARSEAENLAAAQCAADLGLHSAVRLCASRVLEKAPYHPVAAHLYAVACMNTGCCRRAARVWGALARMRVGDTVAGYYDHLAEQCAGEGRTDVRLSYSFQVPPQEIQRRLAEMAELFARPDTQAVCERFERDDAFRALVRWLLYLPSRQGTTARAAMEMLARVGSERAKRMLLAMLMDSVHTDAQKQEALAVLSRLGYDRPCFAFLNETLVHAVPQGEPAEPIPHGYEQVVQETVNGMGVTDRAEAEKIIRIWSRYAATLEENAGPVRHAALWPLALEWAYRKLQGQKAPAKAIARREGVSSRLIMRLGRKILDAQKESD